MLPLSWRKRKRTFFFRKNRVTSSHSTLPDRNCFFSLQIGTKEQSERVIFAKLSLGCLYQSFRSSGWHHPARSWSHSKLSFLDSSTRLFFLLFLSCVVYIRKFMFLFRFHHPRTFKTRVMEFLFPDLFALTDCWFRVTFLKLISDMDDM